MNFLNENRVTFLRTAYTHNQPLTDVSCDAFKDVRAVVAHLQVHLRGSADGFGLVAGFREDVRQRHYLSHSSVGDQPTRDLHAADETENRFRDGQVHLQSKNRRGRARVRPFAEPGAGRFMPRGKRKVDTQWKLYCNVGG